MKITIANSVLQFTPENENDVAAMASFSKFQFYLRGNILEVADNTTTLLFSDIVDNSVFVVATQPAAFEVAKLLGSKQFILSETVPQSDAVILFARDRFFPLNTRAALVPSFKFVVGLTELEKVFSKNYLYAELAKLYKGYADFTESKTLEYTQDEVADKYCRLNSSAITPIIMLSSSMQIMGCIRVCSIPTNSGVKVYLSDEVVKYEHANDREPLMAQLFEGARQFINSLSHVNYAFIRVASGRESMYEKLGCSTTNTQIRVIHDQPSDILKAIKVKIKEVANYKLSLPVINISPTLNNVDKNNLPEEPSVQSDLKM